MKMPEAFWHENRIRGFGMKTVTMPQGHKHTE
jgi:hypothetical protein